MAVPSDKNTLAKVVDELSKYKDLEIEIARLWKMETETILSTSQGAPKKLLFWEQLTSSERFCQSSELYST